MARGKYWSGVDKAAKWGLDICGFAMVDIASNTALHLNACQTPLAAELASKGMNLLAHYASLVRGNAKGFKGFSNYIVADAYFSKKPFVRALLSVGLHFISRLRDDSVLHYKYYGKKQGINAGRNSLTELSMLEIPTPTIFLLTCQQRTLKSILPLFSPKLRWT